MSELIILSLLVCLTNAFWAYVTHKLINKLMSRSFWEYSQAKVIPKSESEALKDALKDVKVNENKPGANELDALDEMIKQVLPL